MPGDKETIEQFAARIKAKYPDYKDIPDTDLVNRIIAKHPEYKERVDFGVVSRTNQTAAPAFEPPIKGTVDFSNPISYIAPDYPKELETKHQYEAAAAKVRINDILKNADPAIKSLITKHKKQEQMANIQNELQQKGIDATANKIDLSRIESLIPKASIQVGAKEIQDFRAKMEQDPNLARETLYEHASLNPSEHKKIAADTYLIDSEGRAKGTNTGQILKNKEGIEKGENEYNILSGGGVKKPEGLIESFKRGLSQRKQQFNDYDFLHNAKDEDIIAEYEKRQNTPHNEDEPEPVAEGFGGGFGHMAGSEGATLGKGALPAILDVATGGGATPAVPWLSALLTSPDFYERGYANSFNHFYKELRDQGHSPEDALAMAKNRAAFDAKADVTMGALMTATGAKMGLPAGATGRMTPGFLGAVKGAVKEMAASSPEAAGVGVLGGITQAAKNIHSDKKAGEGVVEAALIPVAFHFGIKTIGAGAKIVGGSLFKSSVDNMAKLPEDDVNKAIGEQVESGELSVEKANEIYNIINEKRQHNEELINNAKEIVAKGKVGGISGVPLQDAALNNPEQFANHLKDIADRAYDPKTAEHTAEVFGDDLVSVAKQLYPHEDIPSLIESNRKFDLKEVDDEIKKLNSESADYGTKKKALEDQKKIINDYYDNYGKQHEKNNTPQDETETQANQADEVKTEGAGSNEPAPFSNAQVEAAKGFLQQGIENGTIDQEYAPFVEHADHFLSHIREEVNAGKRAEMESEFGKDIVELSQQEAHYPIVKNVKLKDNAIPVGSTEEIPFGETSGNSGALDEGVSGTEETTSPQGEQTKGQNQGQEEITNPVAGTADMTGITHAQMDDTAREFGLTTYQESPEKVVTWDKQADERFAKDPQAMNKLLNRMRNGEQPDAVEQRMMIKYISDLKAKIRVNPSDELLTQLKRAKDLSNIVGGREVAKSLRARQGEVPVEETLPDLLIRKMEANQVETLTPEQKSEVVEQHAELEAAKKEYQNIVEKKEQAQVEQEINKMKSPTIKSIKKSHEEYVKERKDILSEMRAANLKVAKGSQGAMANVPYAAQLIAIAPHVAKLVKSLVSEGVDNVAELIKNIHPLVKDVIPEATEKDVFDIMAGKYKSKPTPRPLSKEELDAKDRLIKIKTEIETTLMKDKYALKTTGGKIKDALMETVNVPRTIMASADLSAPLRQGAVATIGHPIVASKAAIEMLKSAVSQKNFDRWLYDLRESSDYPIIEKSGLYVADPSNLNLAAKEEAFMSNMAEKIPLIGRVVKGSERAYVAYLNKMRVDLFNNGVKAFQEEGKTFENSPELYKAFAKFINASTGRGELAGAMKDAAPLMNSLFFSPRLIASRLQLLNPVYYTKLPKPVRIMALKEMGKFIAFGSSVLAIAGLAGANVELDPRSPDFGKIHVGNTRWDIWGGFQQYIRLASQLIAGQTKSSTTGKINELTRDKVRKTRADVAITFLRGKLAPVPATVWDYMAQKTATGEKFDASKKALDLFTPMIVNDVKEAWKDEGFKSLFTVGLPSSLGVGVSTYGGEPKSTKSTKEKHKKVSRKRPHKK